MGNLCRKLERETASQSQRESPTLGSAKTKIGPKRFTRFAVGTMPMLKDARLSETLVSEYANHAVYLHGSVAGKLLA